MARKATTLRLYYVYILASKKNGTLYIGVTGDLYYRVWEHKHDVNEGFTKRYNVHRLVYFEEFEDVGFAIEREKQLKRWHRPWKLNLIRQMNPDMKDLAADFFDIDPETSSG